MFDIIVNNFDTITDAAYYIVLAASLIAAITPTEADDKIIGRIKNLFDMLRLKKAVLG